MRGFGSLRGFPFPSAHAGSRNASLHPPEIVSGPIDGCLQPGYDLLDLRLADDQGRRQHHGIPDGPRDDAALETIVATTQAGATNLREEHALRLVRYEFNRREQP